VTWNNQPATAGAATSTASGTGWRAWSVAPQVLEMYSGTNHGFLIRDRTENAPSGIEQKFDSRENVNRPQLLLTFG
jgi:large repetitive protein